MTSNVDPNAIAARLESIVKTTTAPWPATSSTAFAQFQAQLLGQFGLTLWTDLEKVQTGYVEAIDATATPAQRADPAWRETIATVAAAVGRKDALLTFFSGLTSYGIELKLNSGSVTDQAAYYVALAEQERPPSFMFPWGSLLDIMISGISAVPNVGGALSGVVRGVVHLALQALDRQDPDPFDAVFKATLEAYRELLETQFNALGKAQVDVLDQLLGDYGKLVAATDLLDESQVVWPQNIPDLFLPQVVNQAEVAVWKVLMPARWQIIDYPNGFYLPGTEAQARARFAQAPWAYLAQWSPQRTPVGTEGHVVARMLGNVAPHMPHLAHAGAQRLFDTLAVPRDDVFNGRNGWNLAVVQRTDAEQPAVEVLG